MKTALPEYFVRHSPKAKNLRLKVTRDEGLVVVVPRGFDEQRIPAFVRRKKDWIGDALKRVVETRRFLEPRSARHLPDEVKLVALGESWPVTYRESARHVGIRLRAEDGKLVIGGADLTCQTVIPKVKDWLRKKVRDDLFAMAERLAAKHRFNLRGLLVKSQRTRWASCSARGNLSLNTKLLFLSPGLVRYVIVHELCHTVHMNHSREFWLLVTSHEPNYKVLDRSLRDAWKSVPPWAF